MKGGNEKLCLDCYGIVTTSALGIQHVLSEIKMMQEMLAELKEMNKHVDPNALPRKIEEICKYTLATKPYLGGCFC